MLDGSRMRVPFVWADQEPSVHARHRMWAVLKDRGATQRRGWEAAKVYGMARANVADKTETWRWR